MHGWCVGKSKTDYNINAHNRITTRQQRIYIKSHMQIQQTHNRYSISMHLQDDNDITKQLQRNYNEITKTLQRNCKAITKKLQRNYKEITTQLQRNYK